jgi:hypothetical protein
MNFDIGRLSSSSFRRAIEGAEGRLLMRILKRCLAAVLLTALPPPIISHAEETPCSAPTIEVASQSGGQRQLRIQSACLKGELLSGRYGGLQIIEEFDANGNLAFQLDCFQGDREVDLTFTDNWHTTNRFCSEVEGELTKVAIVWRESVDLDLHALEYAAPPGSDYDRSARNPGSYVAAQSDYLRDGRSHGFMSTVSDGQQLGHNVEVYTLVRHAGEPRGLIAMAVGLGSHNNLVRGEPCEPLRVHLDVYVLDRGINLRSYEREFAAQSCDDTPTRLVTNLVPDIVLGSARAGRSTNAQ